MNFKNISLSTFVWLLLCFKMAAQDPTQKLSKHEKFDFEREFHYNDKDIYDYSNNKYLTRKNSFIKKKKDTSETARGFGNELNWSWAKHMGGSGRDFCNAIATDSNNNHYITGAFSGTTTFGNETLTSIGFYDIFIAKIDNLGNLVWIKQVSSNEHKKIISYDIIISQNQNLYVTGQFSGESVHFEPTNLKSVGKQDLFLAKYDLNGNFQWATSYGKKHQEFYGHRLTHDSEENIYVGLNKGVSKYDKNGNLKWSKDINFHVNDITTNKNSINLTGHFNENLQLGNTSLISNGNRLLFVSSIDFDGNFDWAFQSNHDIWNIIYSQTISSDSQGNIYIGGFYYEKLEIDSTSIESPIPNTANGFISKITSNGNILWLKQQESENAYFNEITNILITPEDQILIRGIGQQLEYNSHQTQATDDSFVAKISSDGDVTSIFPTQGSNKNVSLNPNGSILNTGSTLGWDFYISKHDYINSLDEWKLEANGNSGSASVWFQIDTDIEGNSFVQGRLDGKFNKFSDFQLNGKGIFVSKMDDRGEIIWAKKIDAFYSEPSGIVTDEEGNVFAWGSFSGSLSIDSHSISSTINKNALYLIKLNNVGEVLWLKKIGDNAESIYLSGGMSADKEGNIVLTGSFSKSIELNSIIHNNNEHLNFFVLKIDTSGNYIWSKVIESNSRAWGRSINTDMQNNIYLTGGFTDEVYFQSKTLKSLGSYDMYITKLDPDGNEIWVNSFGGINFERGQAIVADTQGNTYIMGLLIINNNDVVSFGDVTVPVSHTVGFSNFVLKCDPEGNPLWAKVHENESAWPGFQIDVDDQNSLYVIGQFDGILKLEEGIEIGSLGDDNLYFAKYNSEGELQWAKEIIGNYQSNGFNSLFAVSVIDVDQLVVGGRFNSNLFQLGDFELSSPNQHAFVAWMGEIVSGLEDDLKFTKDIVLYPNPSNTKLNIRVSNFNNQPVSFKILNLNGEEQHIKTVQNSFYDTKLSLSGLSKGLYFLEIKQGRYRAIKRFIKK